MFWKKEKYRLREMRFEIPENKIIEVLELKDRYTENPTNINRYHLFQCVKEILGDSYDENIRYAVDVSHALSPKITWEI